MINVYVCFFLNNCYEWVILGCRFCADDSKTKLCQPFFAAVTTTAVESRGMSRGYSCTTKFSTAVLLLNLVVVTARGERLCASITPIFYFWKPCAKEARNLAIFLVLVIAGALTVSLVPLSSTRPHGVLWFFDFTSRVFKIVRWIVPYNFNISKRQYIEHFFFKLGITIQYFEHGGGSKHLETPWGMSDEPHCRTRAHVRIVWWFNVASLDVSCDQLQSLLKNRAGSYPDTVIQLHMF